MQISVTTESETYSLEVSEDLELENFKVLFEVESGIPVADALVVYNARPLTDDKKTLKEYGVTNGDLLMVIRAPNLHRDQAAKHRNQQPLDINKFDFSSIRIPEAGSSIESSSSAAAQGYQDDPAVIKDMILANPEHLALLRHNNPKLAEALSSGDLDKFSTVLKEQQDARRDRDEKRIKLLGSDPFDTEAQKLIANEIQQESCAERCNIMRLVDPRWAGIAKGVGTQKIIGRVHMGQIQIEGDYLASSFCILEEQPMDMLLGLDMLKRHQANSLLIGTTGTSTRFLSESELPDCARLTAGSEENMLKQSEQMEDLELARALAESAKEQVEASSASRRRDFPESDIKELMQIGFSRQEVIEELRRQNGNKTQAIAALFAKSLKIK